MKNKIITWIVGFILLILILISIFNKRLISSFLSNKITPVPTSPILNPSFEELSKIKVPEKNEYLGENVAPPKEIIPAAPQIESKLRTFEIKGEKNSFDAKEIRVYQNDIVNIKFIAVDRSYDFNLPHYNLSTQAQKGETKTIQFQAINPGKFPFYCFQCSKNPLGYLIVVPHP